MNRTLKVTQDHTYIGEEVDNCLHDMRRHLRKPLAKASTMEHASAL